MKNLIILYISFIFTFISCKTNKPPIFENQIRITYVDTLKSNEIRLDNEVFGSALSMFLIDSTLYIEDYFSRDYAIWALNTKNWKLRQNYYKKGRGPGEVINPTSNCNYDHINKRIALYEPNYKKVIEVDLRKNQYVEYPIHHRDSVLDGSFIQDVIRLDKHYIAMGNFGLLETERFLILDTNCRLVKSVKGYPEIEGIPRQYIPKVFQYGNEVRVKPDRKKLVYGTYIGGLLEIFDISKIPDTISLSKRISIYYPVFDKNKDGSISLSPDTKYGFENIFVTDNYIYTLLFEENKPEQTFPNKITVFDWDGNPVKGYHLDKKIHSLCVDEDNQIIYAMAWSEEESFYLVSFDLKK